LNSLEKKGLWEKHKEKAAREIDEEEICHLTVILNKIIKNTAEY